MKKLALLLASLLFVAVPVLGQSQTSGSLPFTAVTPPAAPTLTSLGGLSASGKIYTGGTIAINGTGFASNCVVNIDGTAQAASTYTFVSATLINFVVPASLGSTAGTPHTLTVSCPLPLLTLNNPGTLPNATVGQTYTANLPVLLQVSGGLPPYTWSLTNGSLPTGLTLSASGTISGTPSGTGSSSFTVTVKDSSGLTIKKFEFNSKNTTDAKKEFSFVGL